MSDPDALLIPRRNWSRWQTLFWCPLGHRNADALQDLPDHGRQHANHSAGNAAIDGRHAVARPTRIGAQHPWSQAGRMSS